MVVQTRVAWDSSLKTQSLHLNSLCSPKQLASQVPLKVPEQAGSATAPTVPPEWVKCSGLLHHGDWQPMEMWAALHPSSHLLAQMKLSVFSSPWFLLQQVVSLSSSGSSTTLGSRGSTKHNGIPESQAVTFHVLIITCLQLLLWVTVPTPCRARGLGRIRGAKKEELCTQGMFSTARPQHPLIPAAHP